jgi:hypothetical protein
MSGFLRLQNIKKNIQVLNGISSIHLNLESRKSLFCEKSSRNVS